MKKFILDLICDAEGHPSCTTVLAITGFAFFIFVTMFLLLQGKTWPHYEIFAGTILTALARRSQENLSTAAAQAAL